MDDQPPTIDYPSPACPARIEIQPHHLGVRLRLAISLARPIGSAAIRAFGALLIVLLLALRGLLGPRQLAGVDWFWLAFLFGLLVWLIASLIRALSAIGRPLILEVAPGSMIIRDPLRFRPRWISADDILSIRVARSLLTQGHYLLFTRRRSMIPPMFFGRWSTRALASAKTREPLEQVAATIIAALGTPIRPWQPTMWWKW